MGLCYVCGKEVEMPHRCPYCNLTFCDDHHLPEQHNCLRSPKRNWKTYRKIQEARGDINPRRGRGLIESIKKFLRLGLNLVEDVEEAGRRFGERVCFFAEFIKTLKNMPIPRALLD